MTLKPRWFDDPGTIVSSTRLVERFLRMVRFDTQSNPENPSSPSTSGQLELARTLVAELVDLGCEEAVVDEHGYVYATVPGRCPGPTIGFIAHLDTAPAFSGKGVEPILHSDYDGGVIRLNNQVVIDPEVCPPLAQCVGDTLITSDGTTLLGADDKAGIAEILAALEVLKANPGIPRPRLRIAFTPDEEIGRGADHFDVAGFGAAAAYTVDGGFLCEINSETFSADKATITVEGVAVHPGEAKGKMVNAMDWAALLLTRLPPEETPQSTDGRQGFFHPTDMTGNAARMVINLILRDFSDDRLARRGQHLTNLVGQLQREEPRLRVSCEIKSQYRNMSGRLNQTPAVLETAMTAIRKAGLEYRHKPIRGGTDGARLTAMGLPTPNLFTGGVNYHGPQEWISTRAMGWATAVILNLIELWAGPLTGSPGKRSTPRTPS